MHYKQVHHSKMKKENVRMFKKDQESGVLKEEITLKNILEYKSPENQTSTGFMPTASLSQNLGQTLSQTISHNLNTATLQNLMNSEMMKNSEIMNSEMMNSNTIKSEMRNSAINNSENDQSTGQQEQAPPLSRSPPLNTFGLPTNLSSVLNALDPNNMQS